MIKITLKPKVKAEVVKEVKAEEVKASKDDEDIDLDELLEFPLYDLRADIGGLISTDESLAANSNIINMIDRLIMVTTGIKSTAAPKDRVGLGHKITSFAKARDAIKGYDKPIISGAQAKQNIPGVGDGIAKRIDEFIKTGKLEEIEKAVDPQAKIILELMTVTGIGEVKAKTLVEKFDVTSVEDLIQKYREKKIKICTNQLTHHIAVGLDFYYDLKLRMPWSDADKIAKRVTDLIHVYDKELVINICGSYRRKRPTCGDIDVLVSHPTKNDENILYKIVSILFDSGLLVGHLTSHGDTKYMGVCRLTDGPGRRIDIRLVPHNSMGAATLYFTGSGMFNKIMRFRSNQRGYTLNEYGLFHYINNVKGAQIPTITEEDVFKILRFKYLEPDQREF